MKRLLLLFIVLLIASCKNPNSKTEESTGDTKAKDSTELTVEEPSSSETETAVTNSTEPQAVTLEDLPKKWYMLSGENGEFYIYKYCYAEIRQLWIEQDEDGGWSIAVIYGQDGDRLKGVSFEAASELQEQFEVVSGYFVLQSPHEPDMDPEIYDFWWNKDLGFGSFSGFFSEDTYMTPEESLDQYEVIEEECDEDIDEH